MKNIVKTKNNALREFSAERYFYRLFEISVAIIVVGSFV